MFACLATTIKLEVSIEEASLIQAALEVVDPDSELACSMAEAMVNTLAGVMQEVG